MKMTAYPILILNMQSFIKFQSVVPEIQMKRAKRDIHTYIIGELLVRGWRTENTSTGTIWFHNLAWKKSANLCQKNSQKKLSLMNQWLNLLKQHFPSGGNRYNVYFYVFFILNRYKVVGYRGLTSTVCGNFEPFWPSIPVWKLYEYGKMGKLSSEISLKHAYSVQQFGFKFKIKMSELPHKSKLADDTLLLRKPKGNRKNKNGLVIV